MHSTTHRFGQTLAAVAHLVVYGLLGFAVLSTLFSLLGLGVGLLIVVIGVIPLGLFAISLAGIDRWEDRRVAGLFDVDVPRRPLRRSSRTDWLRLPQTLWMQITDGTNWLGLLHFFLISVLGTVVIGLLQLAATAVAFLLSTAVSRDGAMYSLLGIHLTSAVAVVTAIGVILLALGGSLALGFAHRAISNALIVPSREEELERTAVVATKRRDDAVSAASIERARLERDLHDGVQPRLVSVGMTLGMAKAKMETDPAAAAALIDEAHTSTKAAITELRQLARGFHPAVLEDRGLDAALSALAARSHVPVLLDVALTQRCAPQTESAMYFAIAESITNAAKHSGASSCRVTVRERPGGMLWARVEDDGRGGAQRIPGGGIDGIAGRVSAAGGTLSLTSPVGGPTTIEVSLPCAS